MSCHSLQIGHGCSDRWRFFVFDQFADVEQTGAWRFVEARHHDVATQPAPEIRHQPLHVIGQRRQEPFGVGRAHGDMNVVADMPQQGARAVVVLHDKPPPPMHTVGEVLAAKRVFVQTDDQQKEQAFGRGRPLAADLDDPTDLRLLAVAGVRRSRPGA